MTHPSIEVKVNAKVWRFLDRNDAESLRRVLDGSYDNVLVAESYALAPKQSWVVIAWNPIGSIG